MNVIRYTKQRAQLEMDRPCSSLSLTLSKYKNPNEHENCDFNKKDQNIQGFPVPCLSVKATIPRHFPSL